jgi:hypothetical protein
MVERAMTNPEIALPVKRDMPANDVESLESEDSLIEKLKVVSAEIDVFNKEVYSELSSFVQTAQEKPELTEGEIFKTRMANLIKKFSDFKILDIDVYHDLNGDPDLKAYFEHDVQKISTNVLTNINLLVDFQSRMDNKSKLQSLSIIEKNWPQYSLIMEDILLRKLEQDPSFVYKKSEIDLGFVDKALNNFGRVLSSEAQSVPKYKRENSRDKSKKIQPVGEIASFKDVLSNDEYVDVPASLVLNSIFNVLRNGCTTYVDAGESGVNLSIEKQGSDLVIRVVDNGIGLSGNQLDSENEKFIFNKGEQKSGRGSTGLGLADLDKRMEKAGGMLRVASRKRGQTVDEMHTYPTKIDERELEDLKKTLQTGDNSTIFEWRLPIKKKELAA